MNAEAFPGPSPSAATSWRLAIQAERTHGGCAVRACRGRKVNDRASGAFAEKALRYTDNEASIPHLFVSQF